MLEQQLALLKINDIKKVTLTQIYEDGKFIWALRIFLYGDEKDETETRYDSYDDAFSRYKRLEKLVSSQCITCSMPLYFEVYENKDVKDE